MLNNIEIPRAQSAKYLDLHFDGGLTWKIHTTKKRKQMDMKVKKMYWFLDKKSCLSLENDLLLCKAINKLVLERWH